MSRRARVTISLPRDVLRQLDEMAQQKGATRSAMVVRLITAGNPDDGILDEIRRLLDAHHPRGESPPADLLPDALLEFGQ